MFLWQLVLIVVQQDLEEVEDDDVDVPLMFAAYQFSEKSSHVRVVSHT